MRQTVIDFECQSYPLWAGYLGEHNATEIVVTKPADLSGAMYSLAFMTNGEVIHSKYFSANEEIKVALWQQLTQDNNLFVQLEAYDEYGDYLGKSAMVKLILSNSAHGTDVVADADNPDVYAEIAQNSIFRETLEDNVDALDKLTLSEKGKLLFDGKPIESGGTGGGGLTEEQEENIELNTEARHTHENKSILDKFGINEAKTRPTFGGTTQGYVLAFQEDVTKRVNELRADVYEHISAVPKFAVVVVDTLPTEDISNTTVYLVRDNETDSNLYTEYIYVNNTWEILGTQSINVDLTEYAKTEDVPTKTSQLENDSGFITETALDEIKAELNNINGSLAINPALMSGTFTDSQKSRARSDYLKVGNNQTVVIENSNTEFFKYSFYQFDENYNAINWGAWNVEENVTHAINPEAFYFGVVVAKIDGTKFTDDDFVSASQSLIIRYLADGYDYRINTNSENIAEIQTDIKKLQTVNYGAKMIYPTGFTSRLMPNVYCERFGEFATDIDIESLKITGGVTVWISTDGNDTNAGTETAPKKTLAGAFAVADCTTVMIKEGTYLVGEHYTASQQIGSRNLIGVGSVVFDSSTNEGFIQAKSSAYIENIEFIGGNTCFKATLTDTDTFCAYKCKFHDSLSGNGLSILGGNSYVIECEAYNAKLDGFNYHANTTSNSIPCVVEWNCCAHNCGDGENTSSNGSTIHDGASIVRIGGEYFDCHGGVVADQGVDETTSSYSINFGVYAHNSTIETEGYKHFNASFWAQKYSKMWLYMCRSSNSTYDVSSFENSVVNCMSMISADMWSENNYTDETSKINSK